MKEFINALYKTALQAELPIVSLDNAARIMAVTYVYGGGNEALTLSPKYNAERLYIQKKYGIDGGFSPAPEIVNLIKVYVKELEDYIKDNPHSSVPEWVQNLFQNRYGFKIVG